VTLTRLIRTTTFRFAALYVVVFVGSVGLLAALAYFTARGALERQIEANVRSEVAILAAAYRAGGMDQLRRAVRDSRRGNAWRFRYQVMSPDGVSTIHAVTTTSSGTWNNPKDASGAPPPAGIKALTIALDDKYKVSVASSAEILRDLEQVLMEVLGAVLSASLLLGLGGGYWISSRYLARVDNIASTAQFIIGGDLKQRIPVRSTDDELDRLAMTLNTMLDRINELMESLRQVSNDIAHDLRTPLARLRQKLDSALTSDQPIAQLRATLDNSIADTDAILDTFGALLRIAQIEAGTRKSAFGELDLGHVVENVTEAYKPSIQDQGKRLDADIMSPVHLVGDHELLTQLVANLIENAIRHTPSGTAIRIELKLENVGPILTISDNGPGVHVDHHAKLFDRFYRIDQSRKSPGSGLGLSLVKAIADLHGAAVTLSNNAPGLVVEVGFLLPRNTSSTHNDR
jgi:signal transduction histidine kinase